MSLNTLQVLMPFLPVVLLWTRENRIHSAKPSKPNLLFKVELAVYDFLSTSLTNKQVLQNKREQ